MKSKKKIYYMDFLDVENGKRLSPLEQLTRERLSTTRDWDRLLFWMDIEFALERLNEYEKKCFVASFIEGYTQREIAFQLNVSQVAVIKQIKNARRKMKYFLKEGYQNPRKSPLYIGGPFS